MNACYIRKFMKELLDSHIGDSIKIYPVLECLGRGSSFSCVLKEAFEDAVSVELRSEVFSHPVYGLIPYSNIAGIEFIK